MMVIVNLLLNAFKNALREINPSVSVEKTLSIRDDKLFVMNRAFNLNQNVHLVAFGKAAPAMVQGAEKVLGDHIKEGIASVPAGTKYSESKLTKVYFWRGEVNFGTPSGLKTKFYSGAEHNLPDEKALKNTKLIEQLISEANSSPDQLFLFLVSGGGSALLTAPISGVSLNDKVTLIRQLQNSGADIKQLNVVRTALSRVKGGGLAKLGQQSKMISLVISDIVGDPLELISSGPTIFPAKSPVDPIAVLNDLSILDKVPIQMVEAIQSAYLQKKQSQNNFAPVDALNLIIASNSIFLDNIADQIKNSPSSLALCPLVVTNRLEGNATELGKRFAELIKQSIANGKLDWPTVADHFLTDCDDERQHFCEIKSQFAVLLFGGESTVRFDAEKVTQHAKGGRNQEMVLSAFLQLAECWRDITKEKHCHFSLISLGSDGQDGPTDAAGAFLTDEDLEEMPENSTSKIEQFLNSKRSYQFWSDYKKGQNLVKIGKTGVNVMDVQMLLLGFGEIIDK